MRVFLNRKIDVFFTIASQYFIFTLVILPALKLQDRGEVSVLTKQNFFE